MAFTDTAALNDSIVLAFDQSFIIANAEESIFTEESGIIAYKRDISAKSIGLPRYDQMALATTPLAETTDPTPVALSDGERLFTPKEYGNVVTTTKLANLQTGGKADVAAAILVGKNASRTNNRLAILALEATPNVKNIGDIATGALVAANVMTGAHMSLMYNKLARANVPTLSGNVYVAVMHDDVIEDVRSNATSGEWVDVAKYQDVLSIYKNEVGMFKGFRIIRNNDVTLTADGGAALVDTYKSSFMGFNGLGLVTSKDTEMVISGPFDKLKRFLNLGWYGVHVYGIVEPTAVWTSESASSVGVNV